MKYFKFSVTYEITREGSNFHQYNFPNFLVLKLMFYSKKFSCPVISQTAFSWALCSMQGQHLGAWFFSNEPLLLITGALVPPGDRAEKNKY